MNTAVRTYVSFQANKFKPEDESQTNPADLGRDLCTWLIAKLTQAGVRTDPEPDLESYGWFFNFWVNDVKYCLVCGFRPGDERETSDWIAWVERSAGLVSSLFGGREKGIEAAAPRLIHDVLSKSPDISAVHWHFKKDFDTGNEQAATDSPG